MKNNILIIDDDQLILDFCKTILTDKYEVFTSSNGEDALQRIHKIKPDLILLDWNMPKRDGLSTLKAIKSDTTTAHIQVVMMTGVMTERERLLDAYNNGATDFLRKPFDYVELLARINAVLQIVNRFKAELTMKNNSLMALTLRLAENYELLEMTSKRIMKLEESIPKEMEILILSLRKIFNNLTFGLSDKVWKQFDMQFTEIHPLFFKNLLNKHPNLSPSELKLSSLIYLKLETKEIAYILHQSYDSIKVSRSRLRRKLLLSEDANMSTYLLQF